MLYIAILLALSSCTYNITMIHTEGEATDLVDEQETVSPNVSAKIPFPM